MIGYLIRRTLQTLVVLFFVTVFTLFLVHLFPGGPIKAMLGQRATVQQVNYYNHLYGFDQPFYVQYIKWIGQLLHGNLGFSNKLNMSVNALIAQDLPKTIVLVALGTIVSLLFGIPLGMYQAVKRYTVGDYVLTGVAFLGYAMWVTLKHLLQGKGSKLSPMQALAAAATLHSADIVLPTTNGREIRLRRVTTPTPQLQTLFAQLGMTLPSRLSLDQECSADLAIA